MTGKGRSSLVPESFTTIIGAGAFLWQLALQTLGHEPNATIVSGAIALMLGGPAAAGIKVIRERNNNAKPD